MVEPSDTGQANKSGDERRPGLFATLLPFLRRILDTFAAAGARRIERQRHRLDRRAHLDAELDDPDFDR
jgi:hypothetical protein